MACSTENKKIGGRDKIEVHFSIAGGGFRHKSEEIDAQRLKCLI